MKNPINHRDESDPRRAHVASVARNGYVKDECPKHGETAFLSYLDGKCMHCHIEWLNARGLVQ